MFINKYVFEMMNNKLFYLYNNYILLTIKILINLYQLILHKITKLPKRLKKIVYLNQKNYH